MNAADRSLLIRRLKAQAAYRWRQMARAIIDHDREAYERHLAWRSAITQELADLSDPIQVALHQLREQAQEAIS